MGVLWVTLEIHWGILRVLSHIVFESILVYISSTLEYIESTLRYIGSTVEYIENTLVLLGVL